MSDKYLLETSIQRFRIFEAKDSKFSQKYSKITGGAKKYSSYFVLYEFKASLIYNLITFHRLVEVHGVDEAFNRTAHLYQGRILKDINSLQALIFRKGKSITPVRKDFLAMLEYEIISLEIYFMSGIVPKLKGDFADNEVVNFKLRSKEDFTKFIELYKDKLSRKIELEPFLSNVKNRGELRKIVLASTEVIRGIKDGDKLALKQKEVLQDASKSSNFYTNKSLGDTIISIDTPKELTILTADHSFEILCNILGKKQVQLSRT